MRAAKLTNGVVTDLWEVPSLTAYASAGITLIAALDNVDMGWAYDGTAFIKPIPTAAELEVIRLAFNATVQAALAAADLTIIRALTENDMPRLAAHRTAQALLRATLKP